MILFIRRSLFLTVMLIWTCETQTWAGEVSRDLAFKLKDLTSNQHHSCLVALKDRIDAGDLSSGLSPEKASRITRYQIILNSLQGKAQQSQGRLIDYLEGRRKEGSVTKLKSLWITNIIQVTGTKEEIEKVAQMPEVERIYDDPKIELVEPVSCEKRFSSDASNRDNLDAIGIRRVWRMGFTGEGRLVCNFDTGVEGEHPALNSKWRGNNGGSVSSSWFDPYGSPFPVDSRGHGTHTMGIMVGSTPEETLGIAFNSEWISAAVIDRGVGVSQTLGDILSAFQWAVNPDGDIQTTNDLPDVISNSWGVPLGALPDSLDGIFWEAIDNVEQAGVVAIFSAGNEGPNPFTIRNPGDRASSPYNSFAVGAVNAHASDFPVAPFSSRGPSRYDNVSIKPELCAPGVEIKSCYKGGEYKILSGTSMAAPFVSATVAILREYNPEATVQQLKVALLACSIDLGTQGEDNDYGYGLINIQKALEFMPAPTKPCVYLDTVIIQDRPADSIVCGDTVKIIANLRNAGAGLGALQIRLRNCDSGTILLQDEAYFDSLGQGEAASNMDTPFVVYLVPSQEQRIVNLAIDIHAQDGNYSRQIKFNLLAKAGMGLGFTESVVSPTQFCLGQNYPNPFNPSTTIPFELEIKTPVSLRIYNMRGQLVKTLLDEKLSRGRYSITWKGEDQNGMKVSSGVYFYRLRTENRNAIGRMILVK